MIAPFILLQMTFCQFSIFDFAATLCNKIFHDLLQPYYDLVWDLLEVKLITVCAEEQKLEQWARNIDIKPKSQKYHFFVLFLVLLAV